MRVIRTTLLALTLVALFMLPAAAQAQGYSDDQVIFGGSFTLRSGETLDGNLVVFGGTAELEEDSLVDGDVVLFGGTIDVSGEITGDLVVIGGSVGLSQSAVVQGDLVAPGGTVRREEGAQVGGQVITDPQFPLSITIPRTGIFTPRIEIPQVPSFPFADAAINPALAVISFLFRTVAISALAVLVAIFLPQHTSRAARASVAQPIIAGGVGLLTAIAVPILLIILLVLTLASLLLLSPITLPTALLIGIVFGIAGLYGWIALGLEVGNRLADLLQREWPIAVSAGLGTFALTFVILGIDFIPCLGDLAFILTGSIGLGAVVLTRFGSQEYEPNATGGSSATSQALETSEQAEPPNENADAT